MTYPDPERCPCGCDEPLCVCGHAAHSHEAYGLVKGCAQCVYEGKRCEEYRRQDK